MNVKTLKTSFLLIVFVSICLHSCTKDKYQCEDYTYNSDTGKCENCEGIEGYNEFDIQAIRTTRQASCLNLSGFKLVYLLDTSKIEGFHEFGQNQIEAYDFQGSRFDSSELFFNDISRSRFEGADLSKIGFGYAKIAGYKDQYTIAPEGCGIIESDSLYCQQ